MWSLRRWHGNKPNLGRKSEWLIPTLHQPYPVFMHSLVGKKLFSIYKIQNQKRMVFWCKFKAHTSSDNKLKNLSKNGRESTLDNLIMTLPLLNNFLTRDEASVSSGSGSKLPTFKVSRVFTWKFLRLFKHTVQKKRPIDNEIVLEK